MSAAAGFTVTGSGGASLLAAADATFLEAGSRGMSLVAAE